MSRALTGIFVPWPRLTPRHLLLRRGLISFSKMPGAEQGAAEESAAIAAAALDSSSSSAPAAAAPGISKKAAQKAAKKAEKAERSQARTAASAALEEEDSLACNYGDLKLDDLKSREVTGRRWIQVSDLSLELENQTVLIRGRVHEGRGKGKLAFLVVREAGYTVQCVASVQENVVSKQMVKYMSSLNKESIVDVEGVLKNPGIEISGTSQKHVEIHVRKVFCVSKAAEKLPLNLEDASRPDDQEGVRVLQDTRLNNRVLDLRTPANQAIFRLQCWISRLFREFLYGENFHEIHSPKLIGGASEGGAAVFRLEYMKKGQMACLAQSPQFHKQMAISGDFRRVFEIGPVFRAENSFTHRHLCEFTGLDVEMEIKEHYNEVMDIIDRLFVHVFKGLENNCKNELSAINEQYPFEPLQYLEKTKIITFAEGVQILKDAGIDHDPLEDLDTETEKKLGKLVKERFQTDFYIMHRYPLGVRPFYTMPCVDDPNYSNSFDVFLRGEEIISGAQRVHNKELLLERATQLGIDTSAGGIAAYIESFSYGTSPHAGFGAGLERVVMLFSGLDNIRKTSMFPRDPVRLAP